MIHQYKAFELVEQINTNQGPVYSICVENDEFENFYVKYIYNENHYDCLVYEVLLQRLANYFHLNTPDIALVYVPEDIFADVEVNNPYFYGGIVGFGSKDLSEAVLLAEEQEIDNKFDFNRYSNPIDVIKILLLDLHCDNRDRHEGNFNILLDVEDFDLHVFDHYDCFGGTSKIGDIDSSLNFHLPGTIFRSEFFRKICKWLEAGHIKDCIDHYLELANDTARINEIIEECIRDIPEQWNISDTLENSLKNYLTDEERLDRLNHIYDDIIRLKQKQL